MLSQTMKKIALLIAGCTLFSLHASAQVDGTAVGKWTSLYSYNEVTEAVEDGSNFYVGTLSGFYTYNRQSGEIEAYSKTSGMANPGIVQVANDLLTGVTVIGYQNSNIDLFKDQTFYNIPSLFLSQASGNKDINDIICYNGKAYLSTGKGLVTIDLERKEIKETVVFYDNNVELIINSATILNDTVYITTNAGLFASSLHNPSFIYYGTWTKVSNNAYTQIFQQNGILYALNGQVIDQINQGNISNYYTHNASIAAIYPVGTDKIGFSDYTTDRYRPTNAFVLNSAAQIVKQFDNQAILRYYELGPGLEYIAQYKFGIRKIEGGGFVNYAPNAIADYKSADVYAYGGDFVVAHGGHRDNLNPTYNQSIYSIYKDDKFLNLPWISDDYNFIDFIRVVKSEQSGNIYAAAFGGGVSEFRPDFGVTDYVDVLEPRKGEVPDKIYAYGLALDKEDNLWVVNSGTNKLLKVKTPDGQWYKGMDIVNPLTANLPIAQQSLAGDIIIDDNNLKWVIPLGEGGIIVYDDKGTIDDASDDQYKVMQRGVGRGNLPSNKVFCAAVDKNNNIWIGTDNGIAIFYCMYDLDQACDADIPVIANDDHPGYLFQDIFVTALAVDGGNRKWVGTNTGLWLVSDDARETIYQFTTANSPLPSDNIKRINIDPITGDVYISTDMGLVRFKGTATEGREEMEQPLEIYPNPVPSSFGGMIAINGLAENSDVRIVDMNGQLVYKTTANGGQAVWDGHDYLGKRAASGVYIVLVRSKDGIEKANGKIIFRE